LLWGVKEKLPLGACQYLKLGGPETLVVVLEEVDVVELVVEVVELVVVVVAPEGYRCEIPSISS